MPQKIQPIGLWGVAKQPGHRPSGTTAAQLCRTQRSPIPIPSWDRGGEELKQCVNQCESHGERTHRPCQPRSRTSAHPTDSSPLFPCPFCHNPTLQHYRLPSVTTTVTKQNIQGELPRILLKRTSENAQKAKFAEYLFYEVG